MDYRARDQFMKLFYGTPRAQVRFLSFTLTMYTNKGRRKTVAIRGAKPMVDPGRQAALLVGAQW